MSRSDDVDDMIGEDDDGNFYTSRFDSRGTHPLSDFESEGQEAVIVPVEDLRGYLNMVKDYRNRIDQVSNGVVFLIQYITTQPVFGGGISLNQQVKIVGMLATMLQIMHDGAATAPALDKPAKDTKRAPGALSTDD